MNRKLLFILIFLLGSSIALAKGSITVRNSMTTFDQQSYIHIETVVGPEKHDFDLREGRVLSQYFKSKKASITITPYWHGSALNNTVNCTMDKVVLDRPLHIAVNAIPNPVETDSTIVCSTY